MMYEANPQSYTLAYLEGRNWAILECAKGKRFCCPADWLPHEASEGDVLYLRRKNGGSDSKLHLFTTPKEKQAQADKANEERGLRASHELLEALKH